jgi:tripartite-type tricarboxylate transporter receptor subunit TctC
MQRAVIRHKHHEFASHSDFDLPEDRSLLLLAFVLANGVRAQPANYPERPVRIISDAAAGGAIDTNLRIIAESLSKKWAQQVVIENRPGAGGAISATAAAQAPPDGYTIYAPASSPK